MKKAISLCMGFTLLVFATVSCVTTNRQVGSDMQASVTNDFRKESYLNGIAYQLSAEVKGLQIQAFKLARIQLDQRLMERDQGKYARPIAIISDIDDALAIMQGNNSHLAHVVGSNGRSLGVVFMEDVLEELVGEIKDTTQDRVRRLQAASRASNDK